MESASPLDRPGVPQRTGACSPRTLPTGERLGDYEVKGVIGESQVVIVYRAWSASLQSDVVLEEYMPQGVAARFDGTAAVVVTGAAEAAVFEAGLSAFLDEARLLARMACPSLIEVHDHWQANQTAYTAMPLLASPSLRTALAELGRVPSEGELRVWLHSLVDGLSVLHANGVLHQNISLDSIALTPRGALLLGLDRAGQALAEFGQAGSPAPMSGFAAIERYGGTADTMLGPWTDFYALAAVVYAAVTGSVPPRADDRVADDRLQPLSVLAAGLYADRFLAGIDAALAMQPERRPQDHLQFRAAIGEVDAAWQPSAEGARQYDPMHEPFLTAAAQAQAAPLQPPPTPPQPHPAKPDAARETAAKPPVPSRPQPLPAASNPVQTAPRASGPVRRQPLLAPAIAAGLAVAFGVAAMLFMAKAGDSAPTTAAAATADIVPPAAAATAAPNAKVAMPAERPAAPTPEPTVAAVPIDIEARCTEILQKASLEAIATSETEFYKSRCK